MKKALHILVLFVAVMAICLMSPLEAIAANTSKVTETSSAASASKVTITTQPTTQKEKAGDTVTFTVKATGKSLKYQWQSSADGNTWKNCVSSTAKKATFTFSAKTSHSSNYYRCKITDANGKVVYTKEVRLYVLGVVTQPATQKVAVGEKVKYTVVATGASKKYQWQSSSDGKTWKNCVSSSAKNATFTFTAKNSHSSNYYRCQIKDSGGNVIYTDVVRLYVLGVTKQPTGKTVVAGDAVKLTVKATGASKVYQWQYSADGKTWKNCVSSSAKNATFTFTGKTSHDGNYYRCRIKDSGGNVVYSETVRLYVLGITKQPVSKIVTTGRTVKFEVAATGNGLKYQWQTSSNGTTWTNCTSASAKEATFTFTGKTSQSGSFFRCMITDNAGNVVYTIKAELTVNKQDPEWSDSTDTIWR